MTDEDLLNELIDVVIQKKQLEATEKDLKLKVLAYIHANGKFENSFATISPAEHQERSTFDKNTLQLKLERECGISGQRLDDFMLGCCKKTDVMPSVRVNIKKP
jgi:hypothetical protein|tara:strand:- start:184 stop:495 length:312 start_codon:yes stop_codon:yes gene_type:complete